VTTVKPGFDFKKTLAGQCIFNY